MNNGGVVYPKTDVEEPKRPFRLWDTKAKAAMRWRCYSSEKNACMGALIEARWAKVGVTIEVFDARNGKLVGQYTRRVNRVDFTGK